MMAMAEKGVVSRYAPKLFTTKACTDRLAVRLASEQLRGTQMAAENTGSPESQRTSTGRYVRRGGVRE